MKTAIEVSFDDLQKIVCEGKIAAINGINCGDYIPTDDEAALVIGYADALRLPLGWKVYIHKHGEEYQFHVAPQNTIICGDDFDPVPLVPVATFSGGNNMTLSDLYDWDRVGREEEIEKAEAIERKETQDLPLTEEEKSFRADMIHALLLCDFLEAVNDGEDYLYIDCD